MFISAKRVAACVGMTLSIRELRIGIALTRFCYKLTRLCKAFSIKLLARLKPLRRSADAIRRVRSGKTDPRQTHRRASWKTGDAHSGEFPPANHASAGKLQQLRLSQRKKWVGSSRVDHHCARPSACLVRSIQAAPTIRADQALMRLIRADLNLTERIRTQDNFPSARAMRSALRVD